MEKPSKSIITVNMGRENEPPTLQLADTPEAKAWATQALAEVLGELDSQSLKFAAPETKRWAYWHTLKAFLEKLQSKAPVSSWDLNREFYDANEFFNAQGFSQAVAFFIP